MRRLLEGGKEGRDDQALEAARQSDVAAVIQRLPLEQQVALSGGSPPSGRARCSRRSTTRTCCSLVRALDDTEVSRILDEMPPEHAADVVNELPRDEAEKILELVEEEHFPRTSRRSFAYPEHSAGRSIAGVVAVREDATVEGAIKHIRDSVSASATFELYVVDSDRHLVGTVPLRRLPIADPRRPCWRSGTRTSSAC